MNISGIISCIFLLLVALFMAYISGDDHDKFAANPNKPKKRYKYIDNMKIVMKDVAANRDLPSNKNLYYSAALLSLNNFDYNPNNVFGAIILQWIEDGRITRADNNAIYLNSEQLFYNELERRLFNNLLAASKDNLLEEKELKDWCRKNYYKFYDVLEQLPNDEIKKLRDEGHIIDQEKGYMMDEKIYNDSVSLLGLKKYLMDFSNIEEKDIEEVHIWKEYLIYANLFGIADKVKKNLKNHYPNLSESNDDIFYAIFETFLSILTDNKN